MLGPNFQAFKMEVITAFHLAESETHLLSHVLLANGAH